MGGPKTDALHSPASAVSIAQVSDPLLSTPAMVVCRTGLHNINPPEIGTPNPVAPHKSLTWSRSFVRRRSRHRFFRCVSPWCIFFRL